MGASVAAKSIIVEGGCHITCKALKTSITSALIVRQSRHASDSSYIIDINPSVEQ